jgi:hypothetical protein
MKPTAKWLGQYEEKRPLMVCRIDLNAYFKADEIAGKKLDRMPIGKVSLPTGE